jgi:hypothetical protein
MPPSRLRPRRESTPLFGSPSTAGVGDGRFYIVLLRNLTIISDLHRRGCTRTAFEFAKLLYSLDPWTDPHGSLLHLDGLALKAGMHEWILDVWEIFETDKEGLQGRLTPTVLPGWWYTRALSMKIREDKMVPQASEIMNCVIERFATFEILGLYIEYQGVCKRSVAFSFPSSAARGQGGCATICGGSIQTRIQSACWLLVRNPSCSQMESTNLTPFHLVKFSF